MSKVTSNKTALLALVVLGAALASFALVPTLAGQKAFATGDDHNDDHHHDDHHHDDCDHHGHHGKHHGHHGKHHKDHHDDGCDCD